MLGGGQMDKKHHGRFAVLLFPNSRYAKVTPPAVMVCVATLFQESPNAWPDVCRAWSSDGYCICCAN